MRAELPGRRVRELGLRETEAEFAERGTGPVAAKIVPCTEKNGLVTGSKEYSAHIHTGVTETAVPADM